jgi:hypothetical protein
LFDGPWRNRKCQADHLSIWSERYSMLIPSGDGSRAPLRLGRCPNVPGFTKKPPAAIFRRQMSNPQQIRIEAELKQQELQLRRYEADVNAALTPRELEERQAARSRRLHGPHRLSSWPQTVRAVHEKH